MADNPFEGDLKKANAALQDLYRRRDKLQKERSWYQNTDPSVLVDIIQSLEAKQKESEDERQGVIAQINGIQEEISRLPIRSMFNPVNWFNAEQRNLRRQRKTLLGTENGFRQQLRDIDKRLVSIREEIRSKTDELQRYHTFERDDKELPSQIPEKEKEISRLQKRKNQIDRMQKPIIVQIEKYDAEINELQRKKRKAQGYESHLGRTKGRSERTKIHKACESEFGVYSPSKLIERCDTDLDRLERGKQKTEKRLRDDTQILYSQDIREVVIDGNNLCYAGDNKKEFVGLVILDKLVPLLLEAYDVTIFFDPGIRYQLNRHQQKLNEQTIENRFAPAIVHITPEGRGADATIVKYASDDKHMYVLSRDRFEDFREYPVFKEKRLIQPEIIKSKLIINDLDVDLRF